ncbi:BirA family biotin operon repressor/biotin-[acetyl-CoA-carboxylase] ligase [Lewinella marina]|uniref:Biotin--[acetyl-CoA-carboxylase] ligase n=1 Tax=Neolewinella marina TaxID=438751 RepID=A0A2G0CJS3_9BACT|nr:biotin--[acetyl-CoA-carboxylase] ligase [Neolewinella marina]NJB84607.1 BirA family biotin operon repressor/biotin-[acetyl-CoA-carboxylase] ligase [Neolewinella marina]PHL00216.1 biotin--[acetyl-CoA-carboxylase] ligase [Neolewinella marina]
MLLPKVARYFSRVDSTNAALLQALTDGEALPSGAVYLTDEQTAGRGQGSNGWHATPGDNLTLSVLCRPDHLSVDRVFSLTEAAALAVAATVRRFLAPARRGEVTVKWPNDVYVGDRKVAGILIQNGLRGNQVQWAVVGIGLNVNEVDFPPEIEDNATSLRQLTGGEVEREMALSALFTELTEWFAYLEEGRQAELRRHYLDALYRRGQLRTFRRLPQGEAFPATITGVDPAGRLLLTHADGTTEAFAQRSLQYLQAAPGG